MGHLALSPGHFAYGPMVLECGSTKEEIWGSASFFSHSKQGGVEGVKNKGGIGSRHEEGVMRDTSSSGTSTIKYMALAPNVSDVSRRNTEYPSQNHLEYAG